MKNIQKELKMEKIQLKYQIVLVQQDIVAEECYYHKSIQLMISYYIVQKEDRDQCNKKNNERAYDSSSFQYTFRMPQLTQPQGQKLLTNVSIITYDVNKYHFEIIAYQNKLLSWKKHLEKDINKVLQSTDIYSNAELGLFMNNQSLLDVFGTIDRLKICSEILQNGKTRYSVTEQTYETTRKLNEISNLIFQRIINPQTGLPYPRTLIKKYITDVIHYNINNFPPSEQAGIIIKQMKENGVKFQLSPVNVVVCLQNKNFIETLQTKINEFNQQQQNQITIDKIVGNLIFLKLQSENLSIVNIQICSLVKYQKIYHQNIIQIFMLPLLTHNSLQLVEPQLPPCDQCLDFFLNVYYLSVYDHLSAQDICNAQDLFEYDLCFEVVYKIQYSIIYEFIDQRQQ